MRLHNTIIKGAKAGFDDGEQSPRRWLYNTFLICATAGMINHLQTTPFNLEYIDGDWLVSNGADVGS